MQGRSHDAANIYVTVDAELDESGVWSVDVRLNGEDVGGGTSPHGFLDVAGDILYGSTNDHLNGDHGSLGNLLNVRATEAMRDA